MYVDCNLCRGLKWVAEADMTFQLAIALIYVNSVWLIVLGITANRRDDRKLFETKGVSEIAIIKEKTVKQSRRDGDPTLYFLSYEYESTTVEQRNVDSFLWRRVKVGDEMDILVLTDNPKKHIIRSELQFLQSVAAFSKPFSVFCAALNLWRLKLVGWSLLAFFTSLFSVEVFLACMVVSGTLMCLGVAILCFACGFQALAKTLLSIRLFPTPRNGSRF